MRIERSNNYIEVFIINYNGKNTILSTIQSLLSSKNIHLTITVIDDCSTDDSLQLIQDKYPHINIVEMSYNTKRANILRNKALELATSDYVFITDNDIKYDENCLSILLEQMRSDERIATCSPRLMYWDEPQRIYIGATKVHFIGATISEQRDKILETIPTEICSNSGSGICLIRKKITDQIGGFDLNLLQGWGSDGEFYQRLLRAGYKCIYVSKAFGLHKDNLDIFKRKYRVVGQTYNRWVFILSHYSLLMIILSIPAFIIYEFIELVFVLIKGIFPQYLKGNYLVFKNIGVIVKKRKFVQSIKVVPDSNILSSGPIYVAPSILKNSRMVRFVINKLSKFLDFYWRYLKLIIE